MFVLSPLLRLCRPFGDALLHVKNAFVNTNRDERSSADKRNPKGEGGNSDENNEVRGGASVGGRFFNLGPVGQFSEVCRAS